MPTFKWMYRNQWIRLTKLASNLVGIDMTPVMCQPSMKVACDGIAFVAIIYAWKIVLVLAWTYQASKRPIMFLSDLVWRWASSWKCQCFLMRLTPPQLPLKSRDSFSKMSELMKKSTGSIVLLWQPERETTFTVKWWDENNPKDNSKLDHVPHHPEIYQVVIQPSCWL